MDYKERQEIGKEYKELYSSELSRFKSEVKEIFPSCHVDAYVYSGIGSPCLGVDFRLIGKKEDQSYGIVDNDPVYTTFIAHLPEVHPTKDTKFKIELLRGGLYIEPQEKYLAMSRVRLPYRKSTGNIAKQVDKLVKYLKGVGETIIANQDKLYKKDIKSEYLEIHV